MTVLPDALRAAKSLRPILEAQADATDGDLTLTKPCIEALTQTNLFHVMVPKELGGLEADTDTVIDVFEELAHQDGSIGWTHMANASATAYCAFLDPQAARERASSRRAARRGARRAAFASAAATRSEAAARMRRTSVAAASCSTTAAPPRCCRSECPPISAGSRARTRSRCRTAGT
ncbi:MAG: hypothetical protein E6J87_07865 [Deltaproteobacteria bacterium]|nr:MAG: hypothetical protein E6J87_07865 [Deltaproteobacteria bacterium]